MAVKKSSSKTSANKSGKSQASDTKSSNGVSGFKKFLFTVSIFLLVILCAFITWLICMIPQKLMNENPRFYLRKIDVSNSGYWSAARGKELLSEVGLSEGMNLFQINIKEIRERTLKIPNIKDADVSLVLPDKIVFNLIERVPRAEMDAVNGVVVVDEEGAMFKRDESMVADRKSALPKLIMTPKGNKELQQEAVKLIITANQECPDIHIKSIIIGRDCFDVYLTHGGERNLHVIFPVENYSASFNYLQNAILHTALKGENPAGFDLRYKNSASKLEK